MGRAAVSGANRPLWSLISYHVADCPGYLFIRPSMALIQGDFQELIYWNTVSLPLPRAAAHSACLTSPARLTIHSHQEVSRI